MFLVTLLIAAIAGNTFELMPAEREQRAERIARTQQVVVAQAPTPTYTPMTAAERVALERACRRFVAQHQGKVVDLRSAVSEQRSETGSN